MNLFVCGGNFQVPGSHPPEYAFALVKPSSGLTPYVTTAEFKDTLFRLCQHHSSLYQVNAQRTMLRLESYGDLRDTTDPKTIELTPELREQIHLGAESMWVLQSTITED